MNREILGIIPLFADAKSFCKLNGVVDISPSSRFAMRNQTRKLNIDVYGDAISCNTIIDSRRYDGKVVEILFKKITRSVMFRDDSLYGYNTSWWLNGHLFTKMLYADGNKHGESLLYDRQGKLEYSEYFTNGELHGERTSYHYARGCKRVEIFAHGQCLSDRTYALHLADT